MAVFGVYTAVMGSTLLLLPGVVLPWIGLPGPRPETEAWVRLLGFVLLCSASYYGRAVREGDERFFRWTVATRFAALLVVFVLVAMGLAPTVFLLFGAIDALGGFWTRSALPRR